ncbi:molybdenum cofactor guanylyltransferase [Parasphingorhabdus sp. JC815]|uniref:molybdenum cofactor guanylyltransferase n=1 Tax=Parasphingorhabdus sp. JC815 TaxID=3232140 RepID=UPI003458CF99
MNDNSFSCLVILAGGQSRRMGRDKATLQFDGQRLIDRAIARYQSSVDRIFLSATHDFDTGLDYIPDDPDMPDGPVGAIFTIAAQLRSLCSEATSFTTIPVDAPFAPDDIVSRLHAVSGCSVAKTDQRLHPVFGHWQSDIVNGVRESQGANKQSLSLQWLAQQCNAIAFDWPDEAAFININTPEDLAIAKRNDYS